MELEGLVPPLELCKLIPPGHFEQSAFCWHYTDVVGFVCRTSGCEEVQGKQWQIVNNHRRKIEIRRKHGEEIYPAPTLQEILQELASGNYTVSVNYDYWENESFVISAEKGVFKGSGEVKGHNGNIAEAALRAWLEEMGGDV